MRIENEEQARKDMKAQVMTFEGEREQHQSVTKGTNNAMSEMDEKNSVCSCTCIGTSSAMSPQLYIDGYLPTDLVADSISLKRASV